MPIAHMSVPVSDLKASTAFYLSALAPIGYGIFQEFDVAVGLGPKRGAPDFWLHKCPAGKDAGAEAAKTHVAFAASSKKVVHAFYGAALKAGAKDNGPPGERPQYVKGYYAAYVLDLDGNNVECVYWQPLWLVALQNAPMIMGVLAVGAAWWVGRSGWTVG